MIQSSALHKPTRLQQAQSRLDSALANLERVAAEYPGGTPATSAPDSGRIEALESEVVALR